MLKFGSGVMERVKDFFPLPVVGIPRFHGPERKLEAQVVQFGREVPVSLVVGNGLTDLVQLFPEGFLGLFNMGGRLGLPEAELNDQSVDLLLKGVEEAGGRGRGLFHIVGSSSLAASGGLGHRDFRSIVRQK